MEQRKIFTAGACLTALLALSSGLALADDDTRQFTFVWPYADQDTMRPRGGTTKGPAVTLDTQPSEAWLSLREPGLSAFERDRRAILAMAGPYRTSYDFLETVGFVADYAPDRPYQSWSTEYVYVVEDQGNFISLQHIIVMLFEDEEGNVVGPVVVKHWRQDWRYQDRDLHVFVGGNTWQRKRLSRRAVKGNWSQAVFQVDDSPRYESVGRWQHHGNYSSWISGNTWRPLPRCEFSVRDDYHVLSGTNRHTITPTGWVQEEHNLKLILDERGEPVADSPYLAREAGLSRYERIVDHDFSAGDDYWERTGPFWADVRRAWAETFKQSGRLTLKAKHDGKPLFEPMFEYAGRFDGGEQYDPQAGRAFIEEILNRYLD